MLTQLEADFLINLPKILVSKEVITFPPPGGYMQLDLVSHDKREEFIVDVNRKGQIKLTKCTYQERYRKDIILLRLDIDGPDHTNPDGTVLPCPHLHIYRENYDDKWAISLPKDFINPTDLISTLMDFLRYCGVEKDDIALVQGRLFE